MVVGFGGVSLAADMVYEGARSVYGPLLGALGASALVVGVVLGAGEAAALILRLLSGPVADRTRRYWLLTIAGYALTAVCVPLLALTPFLGAAGLAVAAGLILAERIGKAVRSPAKSALLATGRRPGRDGPRVGRAQGLGPDRGIRRAAAGRGGDRGQRRGAVARPGRARAARCGGDGAAVPHPTPDARPPTTTYRPRRSSPDRPRNGRAARRAEPGRSRPRLPPAFRWLAAGTALCTAGLVTYGLISFHLVARGVVAIAAVPLLYAAAMAAGAAAALVTGLAYDRFGARVLLALPMLGAAAAPLAFSDTLAPAVAGVLLWGAAVGVQDSTVKALVADLVPPARRATGYGIFAGVQGAGALLGGVAAGALYEQSRPTLIIAVVATQLVAMLLLAPVTAGAHRGRTSRA